MCTVTYFHSGKTRILTSSRDEKTSCPPSAEPEMVLCGSRQLFFSRDSRSGGTWFISDNQHRVAVLLNGAFTKHIPPPTSRKSRGLVLIDLFKSESFVPCFRAYDLAEIEPFQVIYMDNHGLFRLIWDGEGKHLLGLDPYQPYLFSSVTLYDEAASQRREHGYAEFINNHPRIQRQDLLNFHLQHQYEDPVNGLRILKENQYKTHNISQVEHSAEGVLYTYLDLEKQNPTEKWLSRAQPI